MISPKFQAALVGLAALAAVGVGASQAVSGDETAKPAEKAARCVDAGQLSTRMILDKNKLFIEDLSGRGAVLEMAAPCANMDELDTIGFEFMGTSQVCSRTDVKLIHYQYGGSIPAKCVVKSIKHLTREETLAYRKG